MGVMSNPNPRIAPHVPGSKRSRTREELLSAAVGLFQEKGILAVSLDEIAARAGLTKGAIYGNFENKDDLICAVAIERGRRSRPLFSNDAPLDVQIDELVASVSDQLPAALKHLRFLTELDLYVLTHPEAKKRMFKLARERYRQAEENLHQITDIDSLPLPPLEFAIVAHALFNGLLYQRGVWPEAVTDDVIRAAFLALIGQNASQGKIESLASKLPDRSKGD